MAEFVSLPLPTLRRLPLYLDLLTEKEREGEAWLSSESIGRELGLTAIQVRKDLALTRAPASPKLGFRVSETRGIISDLLGMNNLTDVFLLGAGLRGQAAFEDMSIEHHGFKIVALFDPRAAMSAKIICGHKVFPLAMLPNLSKRMGVRMAILTLRESDFPGISRLIANAGIHGLLNLTGEPLEDLDELVIEADDIGFQLASIARKLELGERAARKAQLNNERVGNFGQAASGQTT